MKMATSIGLWLVLAASPSFAQVIWIVDNDAQGTAANCDDPAPAFPTVAAAIAAAGFGDTVLVCPGIYGENINFSGKAITVRASKGPHPLFSTATRPTQSSRLRPARARRRCSMDLRSATGDPVLTHQASGTAAAFV
jgi:uncharacterized protein YbjT (DUF2867 family)